MDELTRRLGPRLAPHTVAVPAPRDTSNVPLAPRLPDVVFKRDGVMRKIGWDLFSNPKITTAALAERHRVPRGTVVVVREKMGIAPARRHAHRPKTAAVEALLREEPLLSDRDIAYLVKCGHRLVAKTRQRLTGKRFKPSE